MSGTMTTLESLSTIKLNFRPSQRAKNGMTYYPLATPDSDDVRILLGPPSGASLPSSLSNLQFLEVVVASPGNLFASP